MMDQVLAAFYGLLAAVLTALASVLVPVVRAWGEAQAQRALATVQQRIGEAAARKAATMVMEIAKDPSVIAASRAVVEAAAAELRDEFQHTARRYGLPPSTFAAVFRGELAKAGVSLAP
jgi:hypothetical protein